MKESRVASEVHVLLQKLRAERVLWLRNGIKACDIICRRDKNQLHVVEVLINFIPYYLYLLHGFFLIGSL